MGEPVKSVNVAAKKLLLELSRHDKATRNQKKTWHEVIDLEEPEPIPSKRRRVHQESSLNQIWTGQLTNIDKGIILSTTGWLNEGIISTVQKMLKEMAPSNLGGFQDTFHGIYCGYEIETSAFVQIVHNGTNHWLTISTIGAKEAEVFIYDSLYCSVSNAVKNQIAALLSTPSKEISLKFVSVQKQQGGCDCGLFAIAFATALVTGQNPGGIIFDQSKMRRHLYSCLNKGRLEMFPILERKKPAISSTDILPVHCLCNMPEIVGADMAECSKCTKWFHVTCVNVPKEIFSDSTISWFCPLCS